MIRLRYRLQDRQIVPMTISISNVRANLGFSGADASCGVLVKADISKVVKAVMSVKLTRAPVRMSPAILNSDIDLPFLIAGHIGSK